MMVICRDREYLELLEAVRGRGVMVWTCNVCARICGVGGQDAADRLAARLASDGVRVTGTGSVNASCLTRRVSENLDVPDGTDTVVSLTCDAGAIVVAGLSDAEVLNPIDTIGPGIVDSEGVPVPLRCAGDHSRDAGKGPYAR